MKITNKVYSITPAFLRLSFVLVILLGLFLNANSQTSISDVKPDNFSNALALFKQGKYAAAQAKFERIANADLSGSNDIKREALYYSFLCSQQLLLNDAENKGLKFIQAYGGSSKANDVYLQLGFDQYVWKRYPKAIDYFAKVKKGELTESQQSEYIFKYGYSFFMLDSLEKARKQFYELIDIDTRYTPSAIYYYAHIAYTQKNYETALQNFLKIKDDEMFAAIVPYYISQIYYIQEKYDALIQYAQPLLDSVIETRAAEMNRLVADAYYQKKNYDKALTYYDVFLSKKSELKAAEYYQPAFCYYMKLDYQKAVPLFEKAALDDSLTGQYANYQLGDCYLKTNQKQKAQMAFASAAKDSFDRQVKEESTFNFAVLTYQLSDKPFNSAIKAMTDYLEAYPNSLRKDEAYNYLVLACINTQNYSQALKYLSNVRKNDPKVKKAYQRASFFRGLELYNNLEFDTAAVLFESSLKYADQEPILAARSNYWLGEVSFRKKLYDEALEYYNQFLKSPMAKQASEYSLVSYNLAYCYFNMKNYTIANENFQKFYKTEKPKKSKLYADACSRIGDCIFSTGQYSEAITYYNEAIQSDAVDKDYATFQKAFAMGLMGKHPQKIELLNNLLKDMPQTKLADNALFEIGRSNVVLQYNPKAVKSFNSIIKDYPSSSFVPKAMLQLGMIDYNDGRNDSAIARYKQVIALYPATPEARNALNGIRTIMVEQDQLDAFMAYAETLGSFANISKSAQDSLLFFSAEKIYTSSRFADAIDAFQKYIDKFPLGNFIINAWYLQGICNINMSRQSDALENFEKIIAKPRTSFTEPSLLEASKIYMSKKNYQEALAYSVILDSIAETPENGMVAKLQKTEAYFVLQQYNECITVSTKLLALPSLTPENDRKARYFLAKSLYMNDEDAKATEQLRKLAKDIKNAEGAEAEYLLIKMLYEQKQPDKASKEIFKFIDRNTPHQYWLAKAYIILSQIYAEKNDKFQAVKTLESIIENYDIRNDGILDEAKKLKNKLQNNETEKSSDDDFKIAEPINDLQ